jgi:hypothetical protein
MVHLYKPEPDLTRIKPKASPVCREAVGSKLGELSERIATEPVGEW